MIPAILDTAKDYLFADVNKMEAAGLPAVTQRHLIRLRDIYNYWLKFPLTKFTGTFEIITVHSDFIKFFIKGLRPISDTIYQRLY